MTRISCCVPFCRRTRKPVQVYEEWLCANHWRALPRDLRQEHSRLKRHFALGRIPPEQFGPREVELTPSRHFCRRRRSRKPHERIAKYNYPIDTLGVIMFSVFNSAGYFRSADGLELYRGSELVGLLSYCDKFGLLFEETQLAIWVAGSWNW